MKYSLTTIILFIILSGETYANQFDKEFTGGIDSTVREVVTGGTWYQEENYGSWRIIVRNLGWEHTRSFLYLQWLKNDTKIQELIEYKTIPIKEFNDSNWYNVERVEFKNSSFVITYKVRWPEVTHTATLLPESPGKYIIKLKE